MTTNSQQKACAYVDSVGKPGTIETNLYSYVGQDPVNWIDPSGLFRWGFGGIIGPINPNWNSSNPYQSNLDLVSDLEIGAGFQFCFDENPFIDDDCDKPKDFPVDVNIGSGKYTGITFNVNKFCINIGLSVGLTPIDVSGTVTSVKP